MTSSWQGDEIIALPPAFCRPSPSSPVEDATNYSCFSQEIGVLRTQVATHCLPPPPRTQALPPPLPRALHHCPGPVGASAVGTRAVDPARGAGELPRPPAQTPSGVPASVTSQPLPATPTTPPAPGLAHFSATSRLRLWAHLGALGGGPAASQAQATPPPRAPTLHQGKDPALRPSPPPPCLRSPAALGRRKVPCCTGTRSQWRSDLWAAESGPSGEKKENG